MTRRKRRPSVWRAARTGAHSRFLPSIDLTLEHCTASGDEFPDVCRWSAILELDYDDRTARELPAAIIATSRLVVLNTLDAELFDLAEISSDMSELATAIDESDALSDFGNDLQIALVEDVAVDPWWRGGGLGPALALTAARRLGADAVFLAPHALPTRLVDGVCCSDYELPRAGPAAQRKVEAAYRSAGFQNLAPHAMWLNGTDDPFVFRRAAERMARAEKPARTPAARSWYLRRARRRASESTGVRTRSWTVPNYLSSGPALPAVSPLLARPRL